MAGSFRNVHTFGVDVPPRYLTSRRGNTAVVMLALPQASSRRSCAIHTGLLNVQEQRSMVHKGLAAPAFVFLRRVTRKLFDATCGVAVLTRANLPAKQIFGDPQQAVLARVAANLHASLYRPLAPSSAFWSTTPVHAAADFLKPQKPWRRDRICYLDLNSDHLSEVDSAPFKQQYLWSGCQGLQRLCRG